MMSLWAMLVEISKGSEHGHGWLSGVLADERVLRRKLWSILSFPIEIMRKKT